MKQMLFILLLMFAIKVNAEDIPSFQNQIGINARMPKLVEVVLTLPFEGLIINQEGISVNYEGNLLAVHSLERSGDQWLVRAGRNECPNGHTIVCRCRGCAVSSCSYCCSCYSDYRKSS